MLERIIQQSDNAGASDADRALNYLAVRYDHIYTTAANAFANNASFTSIDVLPSPLSGTRKIVDVVFAFTDRAADVVSEYFVRVDVTECFPFLVTKLSPYFDR
jgi:PatG C-terminal